MKKVNTLELFFGERKHLKISNFYQINKNCSFIDNLFFDLSIINS